MSYRAYKEILAEKRLLAKRGKGILNSGRYQVVLVKEPEQDFFDQLSLPSDEYEIRQCSECGIRVRAFASWADFEITENYKKHLCSTHFKKLLTSNKNSL